MDDGKSRRVVLGDGPGAVQCEVDVPRPDGVVRASGGRGPVDFLAFPRFAAIFLSVTRVNSWEAARFLEVLGDPRGLPEAANGPNSRWVNSRRAARVAGTRVER